MRKREWDSAGRIVLLYPRTVAGVIHVGLALCKSEGKGDSAAMASSCCGACGQLFALGIFLDNLDTSEAAARQIHLGSSKLYTINR